MHRLLLFCYVFRLCLLGYTLGTKYNDAKLVPVVNEVTDEKGLFISLDGINFGSTVEIDKDYLINGLSDVYPNNTSQWARFGLFPVSTVGIKSPMNDRFTMYQITKTTQILDNISKRVQA